jgi:hypothetical protein
MPTTLTVADFIAIMSPAARNLLLAALEAFRKNADRSRRLLADAEEASQDERELCYTLHVESMILAYLGEGHVAVRKDVECLDLCSCLGLEYLRAEALSHLSSVYRFLGFQDLERAYAREADRHTDDGEKKVDE